MSCREMVCQGCSCEYSLSHSAGKEVAQRPGRLLRAPADAEAPRCPAVEGCPRRAGRALRCSARRSASRSASRRPARPTCCSWRSMISHP